MRIFLLLFLLLGLSISSAAQSDAKSTWVESLLSQMTTEEKLGQIYMIRVFSKEKDQKEIANVKRQIKDYHVGGVCFFQGSAIYQTKLAMDYQRLSKIPLLTAIDGEWGLGMRFDEVSDFPRHLTVGAISDLNLVYRMGREIGRQCRMTGLNVNFAPVVDVNNNPANPVINNRSFGEDRDNVSSKAYAFMKGMQEEGVMACAKHFPGHGDTDVDSHYDLPIISHSRERLDSIELYPFRQLVALDVPSMMVAHLSIPALDSRPNRPTTLSKPVVTDLLRGEMQYDGLIYTDAMEMEGVRKHFPPGEADVQAFLAGNDIILLPADIDASRKAMLKALENGIISMDRLDGSVRRILRAKYDLIKDGASDEMATQLSDINRQEVDNIRAEIYEKAMTLVSNADRVLPLRQLTGRTFGAVALGSSRETTFQKRIPSYVDVTSRWIDKKDKAQVYNRVLKEMSAKDVVFVSLHDMSKYRSKEFGLTAAQRQFVRDLSQKTKVVLTVFGSPYALEYFADQWTVMVAYEENDLAQEVAAQSLFGVTAISGRLPVTVTPAWSVGTGLTIPSLMRLGYSEPERVGLDADTLATIEDIVTEMIEKKAAPGCQVFVAKDNRIVYEKSFGHHTYRKKVAVKDDHVYDLASVTKIMASTISLMHLDDSGLFDLDQNIGQYIPEEDTTNKADLPYREILHHRAGLAGWIPFYKKTMEGDKRPKPSKKYYRTTRSDSFPHQIADRLFMRYDYQDSIWRRTFSSNLRETKNYRYSDLAFYIANRTIKNRTGYQVDTFALKRFYEPLGLRTTMFNPLKKFDKKVIPPTEEDKYFRMDRVQGRVHDMGAAMLDGVSGHAGLFSNAHDIGILAQMLLNKGYYGGYNYIMPETVAEYTQRCDECTRRGVGFDMKQLDEDKSLNMSELAGENVFGHLGFTGTCVFVDPDHNLVYVFLSNRTYPTMENNKFGRNNYRPRVQDVIYRAMMDK